jgi:hypothetical protein
MIFYIIGDRVNKIQIILDINNFFSKKKPIFFYNFFFWKKLSIVIFINFQYFSVIISIFSLLGLETQKSTAIIVSLHNEVIYKMDDDVLTGENLSKFVENFHKNLETLKVLKLSKTILNKATVDSNNPMQELNASTFAETLLKTHRTEPG